MFSADFEKQNHFFPHRNVRRLWRHFTTILVFNKLSTTKKKKNASSAKQKPLPPVNNEKSYSYGINNYPINQKLSLN